MGKSDTTDYTQSTRKYPDGILRCEVCGQQYPKFSKLYLRNKRMLRIDAKERYHVWHDDEGFDVVKDTVKGENVW